MRTIVRGKNLEVPDRVRQYAERKFARLERLLDDRTDAIVELSNEAHRSAADAHIADVTLVIDGTTLRSQRDRQPRTRPRSTRCVDKVERQAIDHKEKPRVRARPEEEKTILRRIADGTSEGPRRPPDRQDQALRHRADVRGGRGRGDGGAGPRLLRVRERRERAPRDPLPAQGRPLRADRAGDRRRVHPGTQDEREGTRAAATGGTRSDAPPGPGPWRRPVG